jgi:non-homologous end joining protein Ku
MTKRAKEVRKIGADSAKLVSLIMEEIEGAASRGENFVKIKAEFHNTVVENIFRKRKYKIGPDFKDSEGTDYFTISWPEE